MSTVEFNQLVVNTADFLKPFAITLTRDSDSAWDLYQETLYRAFVNKEKYNAGTNLKAWLYTIMRNTFINEYRRRNKHPIIQDNTSEDFLLNSKSWVKNKAEADLNLKEIKKAIQHLPAIFKYPFELYFEGYRYQEIAKLLGEPLGTVKSRIHFARKILKTKLTRF